MNDARRADAGAEEPRAGGSTGSRRAVLLVLIVAFVALIAWKLTSDGVVQSSGGGATITSRHNDAIADYSAALNTGKPIYVLFHSLTCIPCVEISEVADRVVPDYEDEIAFVNAITDDPSGQELARGFDFQYIPTSFFLAPDGSVVDAFTGAMDETEMRERIDALTDAP